MSLFGCNLHYATDYHAYIYLEGARVNLTSERFPKLVNNGGTISGAVEIKAQRFEVSPRALYVSQEGFVLELSPHHDSIVDVTVELHTNETFTCSDIHERVDYSDNAAATTAQSPCQVYRTTIMGNANFTKRLTKCDLKAGLSYVVHICIANAYGQREQADSSLYVQVPLTPTNIFYSDPVVVDIVQANTSLHSFTISFVPKETGEAWGVLLPFGYAPPTALHIKNGSYADSDVVC
jgi:hypothetical protein